MYMNYITFIAMSKIKPEQLIGEVQEETENYDLMSVVMICLGKFHIAANLILAIHS